MSPLGFLQFVSSSSSARQRLEFLSKALDEHVSTIRRILEATIAEPETSTHASTGV